MRILAVRGENLASLEAAFEIDLTVGPLGRAGLFAITGPTGAGKSTLLDAICLCLYDKTPRLAERGGNPVRLEGVEDPTALAANDQRNILRRGAGEGWAEVDFSARGGSEWTARWHVWRARKSPSGTVQSQDWSLRRRGDPVDQPVAAGKKSEVEEAIRSRVGLDFEQFRRSVLLAQGDFAAFLRATETERATLLEQMTGTEIYTRLSREAFFKGRELSKARELLEVKRAEHGVLEDEARTAAEAALQAADAARTEAEQAVKSADVAVTWHTEDLTLGKMMDDAQGRVKRAEEAIVAAAPRRGRFERLESAWPLRAQAAEVDRAAKAAAQGASAASAAEAEAKGAEERSAAAAGARDEALADEALDRQSLLDQLTGRQERARASRDEVRDWLTARPRLVQLCGSGERAKLLGEPGKPGKIAKRLELSQRRVHLAGPERKGLEDRLAAAQAVLAKEQAGRAEAETAVKRAGVAVAEAEKAMATTEAALAPGRSEALAEQRRLHGSLKGLAQLAEAVETTLGSARQQQTLQEGRRTKAEADRVAATEALVTLTPALAEAEASLKAARAAADASTLRAQLVEGEPCPVCGGTEHPWADGSPLAAVFAELEARVGTLQAERTRLQQQQSTAAAAGTAAQEAAEQAAGELTRQAAALEEHARDWLSAVGTLPEADALRALGPGELDAAGHPQADARRAALVVLGNRLGHEEKALREDESARSRAQAELKARMATERRLQEAQQAARDRMEQAAKAIPELQTEVALLGGKIEELDARVRSLEGELAEDLDPLVAELPDEALLVAWREQLAQPEALLEALGQLAQEVSRRQERLVKADDALAALVDRVPAARVAADRAAADAPDLTLSLRRAARTDLAGPVERLHPPELSDWLSRRVADTVQRVRHCVEALKQAEEAARTAADTATAARATARTLDEAARQAAAVLRTSRTELGLDEAVLAELLALPGGWLEAERKALSALDEALRDATVLLGERQRRRESHGEARPAVDADAASEALTAARAAKGAADQAWSDRRSAIDQDDRARRAAQRLEAQLVAHDAKAEPWLQLSKCIGSASGVELKRFAQSLTLELLLEQANAHLSELHPRYRLARIHGSDLDILVVDGDLGDEPRTVRSLSGGESFLVSLALALGLSSLSSKDVRVESLFIDEGFGTLDAHSLDTALSVLDSLQAEGRQVGVISHVGGLAERIGVRVSVEPLGGGRSRVRVVG